MAARGGGLRAAGWWATEPYSCMGLESCRWRRVPAGVGFAAQGLWGSVLGGRSGRSNLVKLRLHRLRLLLPQARAPFDVREEEGDRVWDVRVHGRACLSARPLQEPNQVRVRRDDCRRG